MDINEIQLERTKDYLGKSINGYFDNIVKDLDIYQDDIDGIERIYNNYEIKELSPETLKKEPFYSNTFQSLIDNEADNRYNKAFYSLTESLNKNEDLDTLNSFIEDFESIIYELDNIKTIQSFNEAGLLTKDNGFIVTLNDGHKYQIVITQAK